MDQRTLDSTARSSICCGGSCGSTSSRAGSTFTLTQTKPSHQLKKLRGCACVAVSVEPVWLSLFSDQGPVVLLFDALPGDFSSAAD